MMIIKVKHKILRSLIMPIYEYQCQDCNKIFEYLVFPGEDEEKIECKNCKSTNIKKLLSTGSIRPNGIPGGKGGFNPPPKACSSGGG